MSDRDILKAHIDLLDEHPRPWRWEREWTDDGNRLDTLLDARGETIAQEYATSDAAIKFLAAVGGAGDPR